MLQTFLWAVSALSAATLLGGILFAWSSRSRGARTCGAVVRAVVGGRRWLHAALALQAAALVGLLVSGAPHPALFVLPVLAAALVALTPAGDAQVCGANGVRRGFHARPLAELEEWRLTGDHLRFRLHGEWTSVELAADKHGEFRERLARVAPERESRFAE